MDWNKYYLDQAGGGNYNYYTGELYQKGYGLGGTFKRFFHLYSFCYSFEANPSDSTH